MELRLILLGSGQDGGSPQMGSSGAVSDRTASSVALVSDLWPPILFDASPDLRSQHNDLVRIQGGDAGDEPFSAVFITHGHMGHYAGLVHFGKEAANTSDVPLYGDKTFLDFLSRNEPWASLVTNGNMAPRTIPTDGVAFGRVTVKAIPVPHRADFTATNAYSISVDSSRWALYLPDIDAWTDWPEADEVIAAHDLCFLDATFGSMDELPGRSIAEIPHPLVDDTLSRFARHTDDTTIVLTHINHSNELNDPDSELSARAHNTGFKVGSDGMVFWYGAPS
ncbi:MAG: MBL fold metallo-hydrolase [Acidimicrobiia bacterium]